MTPPAHNHRNYSRNLQSIVARRSYLCGRFIARDLSQLLILILLVLSPLTYSNENIPNFQPDAVSSGSLSTKAGETVAVVRAVVPAAGDRVDAAAAATHTACSTPHLSPVCSSRSSRSPPA